MREHPRLGWALLQRIEFLRDASVIVLQHQERFDGRGYPVGLKEEQIVLGARSVLSSRLLSEFRYLLGREIASTTSLNPARRIVVLDAFTGGGAQADQSTSEYHFNLTENLTYVRGHHLIKGGFAIPDGRSCSRSKGRGPSE